ncbi:MAG: ABC transporter ATP-binding protein/permease, partial [Lachnospiraceae bacterium]|nr:ABC transporter ATP-binding protein/permease [Lachnospiraceae bacterium]
MFGRCELRADISYMLFGKAGTCSYPFLENHDFNKLLSKAHEATSSNQAPVEDIWNTFAKLLQNLLGFSIYLYLLTNVDWLLIVITAAAALISYLVGIRLNGWGYRHRQEESDIINRFDHICRKCGNRYLAKDVRIFGMEEWLRELLQKYLKLHQDFCFKREKIYLIADFTDLGLSILRNGFAYAYLLHMVLNGNLSAAEFLLYFTAVSGFTAWISGIMENLSTLHKQSIDMVPIREMIDYPEVFSLDEGESLVPVQNASYTIELRDVSFRYPESGKVIFSHLNLTIHAGEKLAVVGLNGAGKTTLIKLICGFYDPDEGEVLLNG